MVGYGPQEGDREERKQKFWDRLEMEVSAAQNQGTGLIIQMDGNLWAGPDMIPGDPHQQNKNGQLFERFLARNSHLSVANTLEQCTGVNEKSVLDFFILCDKVRTYFSKMIIDEDNQYSLTNFHPAKSGKKVQVIITH